MRILVTSDTFLPLIGGAEIHVKEICEHLVGLGHEVTLLTNEVKEDKQTLPFRVVRRPWSKKNIGSLISTLNHLAKGVDIIHCHYSYRLAAVATLVARLRGIPSVVVLHGLGTLDEPGSRFPYKQVHAIYRFCSLSLATRVISTSEDIAKVARTHMLNPKKVSIIFNGLDTSVFNSEVVTPSELVAKYPGQKIVLTVRRLVPKNGIHFLVEAMPYILKKVPNAHYLMVGTGRMEGHIRSRINELGIADHIHMVGAIPNTLVSKYLSLADVVVFPSTAESTSIACAEAMAMGKTVVASRVGGLIELIGAQNERGILVKMIDWEGSDYDAPISLPKERYELLADAVVTALSGDQSGRQRQAREFAQNELDWGVVTNKTIKVYNEALEQYGRK